MQPDDVRHGSVAGYAAHHKSGDLPACDQCKRAMSRYQNQRILRLERGDVFTVPALGTTRRIRALVAIGWPMPMLSARIGAATPQTIQNLSRKPPESRIQVATAEKIARLYDELCMTHGPSSISALRARNKGWAPPLAWDDIDDPTEQPTGFVLCSRPKCQGSPFALGMCRNHYYADLTARRRQEAS